MPRTYIICKSSDRKAIDAALIAGDCYETVAERFGMSTTALHRHKTIHLAALVKAAREERTEEDLDRGEDRLDQVQLLVEKAKGILDIADDQRTALVAAREPTGILHGSNGMGITR